MHIDSGNITLLPSDHCKPDNIDPVKTEEFVEKQASQDGLIGAFKLTPADEAVERLSRRRRNFDEEHVEPFMRSMPYGD